MIEKDISQYLSLEQRARNLFGENYDLENCVEELRQFRKLGLEPKQVGKLHDLYVRAHRAAVRNAIKADEYMEIGTLRDLQKAMNKQNRKPVKDPYGTSYIWEAGYCPVCGCGVTARWNYCQCCGQKLSWENHDVTK